MKIDADLGRDLDGLVERARLAEADGYDALWLSETGHDPLTALGAVAPATTRALLGTGIAVAFARSPMTLATAANDLQILSGGRFLLGLGSQVRPHIERRYSMPWSHPARRMREYVLALRAIWASWHEGERLFFRGEFYRHTLMTPFFNPGPSPFGAPPVYLAAVGEAMTAVAGEVADGLLVHPFTTAHYLAEVTHPALSRGRERAGRDGPFEISLSAFVVTGASDDAIDSALRRVREQIAFYGSTPAYRAVLESHGWSGLHEHLHELSSRGAWEEMGRAIDEEVLHTFAVVAPPEEVGRALRERFGDLVTRLGLYTPYDLDPAVTRRIVSDLRD